MTEYHTSLLDPLINIVIVLQSSLTPVTLTILESSLRVTSSTNLAFPNFSGVN
jgi:hypothetical protein